MTDPAGRDAGRTVSVVGTPWLYVGWRWSFWTGIAFT